MKLIRTLTALVWTLAVLSFAPAQAAQVKVVVIPMSGEDLKPLKNVITVAKANGDFTDPVAAVASIPTTGANAASASNPYLIVIAPGVYTVTSPLIMKPYVGIAGSGQEVTKITGTVSTNKIDVTSAVVSGANNAELSDLTLENTGGGGISIGMYNENASPRILHVMVEASGGSNSNYGVYDTLSSSPSITNVTITASGGLNAVGVYNFSSSTPDIVNVATTASGGANNNGVVNFSSSPTMTNVTATAFGGISHGVSNQSSSPTMINVTASASGGTESYGIANSASSPIMTNVTAIADSGSDINFGISVTGISMPRLTNVSVYASGSDNTSFGVFIDGASSSLRIEYSSLEGSSGGIQLSNSTGTRISYTRIVGPVLQDPSGTQCLGNYDANLNPVVC